MFLYLLSLSGLLEEDMPFVTCSKIGECLSLISRHLKVKSPGLKNVFKIFNPSAVCFFSLIVHIQILLVYICSTILKNLITDLIKALPCWSVPWNHPFTPSQLTGKLDCYIWWWKNWNKVLTLDQGLLRCVVFNMLCTAHHTENGMCVSSNMFANGHVQILRPHTSGCCLYTYFVLKKAIVF